MHGGGGMAGTLVFFDCLNFNIESQSIKRVLNLSGTPNTLVIRTKSHQEQMFRMVYHRRTSPSFGSSVCGLWAVAWENVDKNGHDINKIATKTNSISYPKSATLWGKSPFYVYICKCYIWAKIRSCMIPCLCLYTNVFHCFKACIWCLHIHIVIYEGKIVGIYKRIEI